MGREVRMVPADWEHPKEYDVYRHKMDYIPLLAGSYDKAKAEYDEEAAQWNKGFVKDWANGGWKEKSASCANEYAEYADYEEWAGEAPEPQNYMPAFEEGTANHFMMYETCSDGTPISPAFETPEELAHWLADTGASAFGDMTATYEQWLATIHAGSAPSAVIDETGLRSGVSFM